jgi:cellulose synthase operon protein C
VPASAPVIDAFLAKARAWVMTTHAAGQEILRRVSRAAQHHGLVPWLVDLMREPVAPWPSRIETASALAGRLRVHTDEASGLLKAVIGDEAVPIQHRLTAAESLVECGDVEREAAQRELGTLLVNPAVPANRRRNAAVLVAGLGARGYTVDVLTRLIDDPQTSGPDRVEYAAGLAEIDIEFHPRSAAVFRTVLHDPALMIWDRKSAALGLAALGVHYQAEAVDTLVDLATNQHLAWWDRADARADAAAALAEIGPQHRAAAGQLLLDMLAEPGLGPYKRWSSASALAQLGAEFHADAAAHLCRVIADPDSRLHFTVLAAKNLVDLGPDWHTRAAEELADLAADPLMEAEYHAKALGLLAKLGEPYRSTAVTQLRLELADRDGDQAARCWAGTELVELGPEFHAEATTTLLEIVSTETDADIVDLAWGTLATLGTQFHQSALYALLGLLRSPMFTRGTSLYPTLHTLAKLDAGHHEQAAGALRASLADEKQSDVSRWAAAMGIHELGRRFRRMAMNGSLSLLRQKVSTWGWDHDWVISKSLFLN